MSTPTPPYTIVRLECNKQARIDYLRANVITENFFKIFPWESECMEYPNLIHYIAVEHTKPDTKPIIHGWMTVEKEPLAFYIKEISTQRNSIRGVGKALHMRLVHDVNNSLPIYLLPLDGVDGLVVGKIYIKWGYREIKGSPYMAYWHNEKFPGAFLGNLAERAKGDTAATERDILDLIEGFKEDLGLASPVRGRFERALKNTDFKNAIMELIMSGEDTISLQDDVINLINDHYKTKNRQKRTPKTKSQH